ncbi:MAG: hypothetical protein HYR96_06700 [Deltaproteobacteria bacterium]|nr:hypothetical protein [Deltaproteobacteria bacterium]MBI3296449.1 hypothetical protein [Deltaproteobacteria bacterium]
MKNWGVVVALLGSIAWSVPLLHTAEDPDGDDSPPVVDGTQSRSLFDSLVRVGADGVPQEKIYPFSELMTLVGQKTGVGESTPYRAILIPFSRALERQYASLRLPRALFGVDTYPIQSNASLGLFMKDRLFVGFSKTPKVLEVISFNERASRFEFQLVQNYGEDEKGVALMPKVVYASRPLCITCHKNHAPMFSRGPWSETNGNPAVSGEMKRFHNTDNYEGIGLNPGHNGIAHKFDLSTDKANLLMPLNEVWVKWCGATGPKGDLCRARMLQLGLSWSLDQSVDESDSKYTELVSLLRANWADQKLTGFQLPNFDLNNRDPFVKGDGGFSADSTPVDDGDPNDPKKRLEDLVNRFNLSESVEPAKDACHVPPDENSDITMTWDDPVAHGLTLIYSWDRFLSPADLRLLRTSGETPSILAAVEKLVGTKVLSARPINRPDLMKALLSANNAIAAAHRLDSGEVMLDGEPIVNTDGNEVHAVLGKDARVAPFWNSCRECHLKAPVDFSEAKSDDEILKVISNPEVARKMLTMLDWDNNPPSPGPMPRRGSRQYKALLADDQAAKVEGRKSQRQKMLEILQGFLK